jgi:hypothetical protein
MLKVAGEICGLHAQVMSSAELMLWARVEGLTKGAVPRAVWEHRTLVKIWAMRGTLHLLPVSELPMWQGALSTSRRYRRPAFWRRVLGITLDELDQLTQAIGAALDGRVMTRDELAQEVGRQIGSVELGAKLAHGTWGTVLKPAAFAGSLCFGPSVGQRVRYTRPATWVAALPAPMNAEPATAALTRRFLSAYGPATYHDFARWWGHCGVATARQWIAALGDGVTQVELAGERAWMLAADAREARDLPSQRSVRLLPAFDQYVIGASRHADLLLPGKLRSRVYRPQGWVSPVLLVNGLMQGVWRHEIQGSRIEIVIEPFVKTPTWVRRAAAEEAERLATFLGGTLSLGWKK